MKRPSTSLIAILILAWMVIATAACAYRGGLLEETGWRLVGWSISSQRANETAITARFAAGRMSGNSGVNSYSGPYRASSSGEFAAGPFERTEMAGPQRAMRAESAYMTLLQQAASYKTIDGRLTLSGIGGNELLIFEPTAR